MTRPAVEVLLRGEESGGRLALVEMTVEAGVSGPPLHTHQLWDGLATAPAGLGPKS